MKKSVKITKKSLLIALFALIFATSLVSTLTFGAVVAHADDASADNFVRVFPQNNYFQSANPTLVSANDNYLVIYDSTAKTLFVRPNDSSDTQTYAADFEQVNCVFILDDVAFLQADDKYFTIDLTDKTSVATERTLTSPERISTLASDGNYLYAHYLAGDITIYDKNLEIAFGVDNQNSSDLVGKIVIAGESDDVYAFPFSYGNAFYVCYNATTKQTESHAISQNITQAYVGDVMYALALIPQTNKKNIVCLDKQTGALLVETDIYPDEFFAHGNRLFTIEDKSVVVYTLSSDKTSLTRTTSITMTGSDAFHLDNPTDLCISSNAVVVADSNNDRLAYIDKYGALTEQLFSDAPLCVTSSGKDVYCGFENKVCKISGYEIAKTYSVDGVVDVAYLDKLYVLTKDGVYTAIGNSLVKIFDVANGKRVACAKDGSNVYVLTSDSVLCLDRNGSQIGVAATNVGDAVDVAIDYEGKVYVASQGKIDVYYGGNLVGTTIPSSTSMKATLTSVCLDGENLLFTAKESFVGAMSVGATTKQNFEKELPNLSDSNYYFAIAKEGALNYSWDGRLENTSFASNETYLVFDKQIDGDESNDYRYARVNEKLVIIDKNDFETVNPTTLSGDYCAKDAITLYSLPYCQDGAITIEKDVHVTRVSDVAGYDNSQWAIVKYDEKSYFVKSSDIEQYVVVTPEQDKVYGKANADRVGGFVNVYTSPDTSSEVVTQILDGSKVEVLETLNEFYLVSIDGKVGYVDKDHLKINGLTTVQIVAIVLAIVVALAGTAIYFSIYLTRKNADNKKDEDKPQKRF